MKHCHRFVIEVLTSTPDTNSQFWELLKLQPSCLLTNGNSFTRAKDARHACYWLIRNGDCLLPMRVCRPDSLRAVHVLTAKQVKQLAAQRVKETTGK